VLTGGRTQTDHRVFIFSQLVGLGQQFATIEAVTFMSLMFRRFDFELVDPHNEPGYGAGLTLPVAKGLPIRVIRRH